jgi:NitT/TauT family transport system ATP-binding protein/sulfonate transport system ATP-binding protein
MVGTIQIKEAVKRFCQQDGQEIIAVDKVNLSIQAGEFISFIGPSGCGKSTLLRMIAGLGLADEGVVELDGQSIRGPSWERGLVFQNPLLFPWLDIYHNVSFGLRARGIYHDKKAEVEQFLSLVGLQDFQAAYPHQLSGGMAQRAALARALVNHPKVLLLDEPLGALDAFTRMNMQDELLHIWQEEGTTMVMVTHDVDEAIYLSDRVFVMTPRPAKVAECIEVGLSRPRNRSNPEFLRLRSSILKLLDFAGHEREPDYYL